MAELTPGKPRAKAEPVNLELVEYPGLTARQNLFVFWLARSGIGSEAAQKAGYSKRSAAEIAYKMLNVPKVQDAVKAERKRHLDAVGVDEAFVTLRLKDLSDKCSTAGETYNPAAAIRATELLGKTMRMFTDQVDHTVGLRLTHEEALGELDDQELDTDGRAGEADQATTPG